MAAELKRDDVVKNAEGVMMRVRYVNPARREADVYPFDGELDDTITLPLDELKRVIDPKRRLPPIEGLPAERPRCAWCARKLRPRVHTEAVWHPHRVIGRKFEGWSTVAGGFCTNACAIQFAGACYHAGYRRERSRQ